MDSGDESIEEDGPIRGRGRTYQFTFFLWVLWCNTPPTLPPTLALANFGWGEVDGGDDSMEEDHPIRGRGRTRLVGEKFMRMSVSIIGYTLSI